ncbi:MAG: hypothetical protein V4693_04520 [Pseudomonadota bacterium]
MDRTSAALERQAFSDRLAAALNAAGYSPRPGDVAVEFNKRARGASVTIFAVRKWLNGNAIPTQEKIHVFAAWLGVTAHWLRFGDTDPREDTAQRCGENLRARERKLLADILLLDEQSRAVLDELVASLLKHYITKPTAPPQ